MAGTDDIVDMDGEEDEEEEEEAARDDGDDEEPRGRRGRGRNQDRGGRGKRKGSILDSLMRDMGEELARSRILAAYGPELQFALGAIRRAIGPHLTSGGITGVKILLPGFLLTALTSAGVNSSLAAIVSETVGGAVEAAKFADWVGSDGAAQREFRSHLKTRIAALEAKMDYGSVVLLLSREAAADLSARFRSMTPDEKRRYKFYKQRIRSPRDLAMLLTLTSDGATPHEKAVQLLEYLEELFDEPVTAEKAVAGGVEQATAVVRGAWEGLLKTVDHIMGTPEERAKVRARRGNP